ncbi:nitric oxide reductase activation protein NorD [Benzoatithermus flavus]|uniref:VWA domain-containing protein n=1 Tax=Benzoatithermus flavus TaxID=3108223 RepID=A0ABU8XV84_9PROT
MGLAFLEFEEQFGRLWHRLVGDRTSHPRFPDAAVALEGERARLAVLFRGLGGDPALEVAAGSARTSGHRLSLRQRLGMDEERLARAERTSELVLLPPVLDCLPTAELNRDLYVWLTAFLAAAEPLPREDDPLRRDVAALRAVAATTARVLEAFPGLAGRHARLAAALLELRPARRLTGIEAEIEVAVRRLHGETGAPTPILDSEVPLGRLVAPRSYRPFLPSPLWGEVRGEAGAARAEERADTEAGDATAEDEERLKRRAKRQNPEDQERKDPLTLINKGEVLALPTEMTGVNRPDDEEDPDAAREAAQDMDELTLGRPDRRSSSRVRMELDITGTTAAAEAPVTAALRYPEWNHRRRAYLPAHCAVFAGPAGEEGEDWRPDAQARRHIRLVRRQFEALRPRREILRAQVDGNEFDMDALVRSRVDLLTSGVGSDRIWLDARNRARDLATLLLVDGSLSTDAWVDGRRVLDVEKEALTALAFGLEACGDPFAILTFSSRTRREVRVESIKGFDERLGEPVRKRIAALRPGHYTRMGAALRHAASELAKRPERHRLLLLLSDGKPNDLDHYEGRYGVEDTRKAVLEARGQGLSVFAVTVDRRAESYVPFIFGRGGYAMVGHLGRLPEALAGIYRQLVS